MNELSHSNGRDDGRPLTSTVLGLVALVGFGPLLAQFLFNLWNFDTYQFFPLALAGAGFLLWRGLQEVERPLEPGSVWLTVPLVLAVLLLLAAASVMWSPWIGMVSFLLAIFVAAWWFGGWSLLKAVFPGWLVLLTILPPPLKLDTKFALLLQEWATAGSSKILALLGVPHLLTGLIIEIPGQRLLVEEACSGINSILFMTSACVFYAMWKRRSLLFLAVLYALTISCVLAGNLVRITSGAWILYNFQIDLFVGWKHEALGLVLTATYLGFIVGVEALMGWIFTSHGTRHRPEETPQNPEPLLDGLYFEGGLKFVSILLAILCAAQLLRGWDFHFRQEGAAVVNPDWMDGSAKFSMPAELDGWQLVSEQKPIPKKAAFEDGVYSHIWQYRKGGTVATISFDYPFFGYHDVTVCYGNAGWEISETALQRASAENGMIPCMEVKLSREGGLQADLLYSTVDETGVWLEEPGTRSPYDPEGNPLAEGNIASRLIHRFRQLPYANESYNSAINYRIQLLAAARGGLGAEQRRDVEKLFREARPVLANQFVKAQPAPAATPTPAPVYEPLPEGVGDASRKAIEEARKAAQEVESAPDATKKAIEEAVKSGEEKTEEKLDATQKAIREAMEESTATEEEKKSE
ncbi:MAG: exosortase U [Verrucomicrobiota bacterium]